MNTFFMLQQTNNRYIKTDALRNVLKIFRKSLDLSLNRYDLSNCNINLRKTAERLRDLFTNAFSFARNASVSTQAVIKILFEA